MALREAPYGRKADYAKPLQGFHGSGVLEVVEDCDTNTYRAVYTIRFEKRIFVLHAFQKKAKQGRKTPIRHLELIEARLKIAEQIERRTSVKLRRIDESEAPDAIPVYESSGNVFADLDLPDPDLLQMKADLMIAVMAAIEERGLTQTEAAHIVRAARGGGFRSS